MSGDTGGIERGDTVFFKGEEKVVKDFYFVSDGECHNSDIIRFIFTDGTTNEDTGFTYIKGLEDDE